MSRVVAPFVSRSCQVLVPLDPSVAWRMRALVNLTSFCRLDKLNWKIGYRRFCSGQCLHRLVRHVWSKGWDRRKSRPQPRFPAPRHRPLPHLLPLAITPPGEGRPCQPKDCPYPPDFTRLLLFGAPWSYPGHGLLGGNHSVVISRLFARQDIGQGAERLGSCSALCATAARMTRTRLCTARAPGKMWVKVSSSECPGAQPSSCGRNRTRGCSGSSTRRRAFFKVHVASCHFIHRTAARGPVMIRHGLKLG